MSRNNAATAGRKHRRSLLGSIGTRLALWFSLAFIVILTLIQMAEIWGVPFTQYSGMVGYQRREALRSMVLIADLKKERLHRWLKQREEDVQEFSDCTTVVENVAIFYPALRRLSATAKSKEILWTALSKEKSFQKIAYCLENIKLAHYGYECIDVVDVETGVVLVSTDRACVGKPLRDQSCIDATLSWHGPHVNLVGLSPDNSTPVFTICHVIGDSDISEVRLIQPHAILVVTVDINSILRPILHTGDGLGKQGEALLVNEETRNLTFLKHPLADGRVAEPLKYQITAKPARLAASGKEGLIEDLDYRGEPILAAYRHIRVTPEWGWGLVVKRDKAELLAPIKQGIAYAVILGAMGVIGFIALAVLLARNLTRPIRSLSRTAEKVARGDFSVRSQINTSGEVGLLATTFDEMIGRIQNWHTELESEIQARTASLESANKALEESNEAAQAANRAKSAFLANMSHEIRTPMTAILGFADMIRTEGDLSKAPPQRIEAIDTITRNGEHLLNLINGILDLSQIEAGKLQIDRETCLPSRVVSEVMSLMKVRVDTKGLSLTVEFDGKIPESIKSDSNRLRQILINLVANAIKFTEDGHVRVVTRLSDGNSAEPKMHFEVTDTGIGMSEEQMTNLFKPFSQVDSSATRRFGGTGLGLAISKRLAEMLGGDISVRSSPGKGSTFTLTISTGSLEGVKLIDGPTETECHAQQDDKSPVQHDTKLDCRILLAEDGPDNQRIISFLLKKAGAEVTVANNGQVALDCVGAAQDEGNPFDVILMDMQMPVMDGYDATKTLRAAGYSKPIIALTAHAMKDDRLKCLEAGCNDYMTKPIDHVTFLPLIARYAENRQNKNETEPTAGNCLAGAATSNGRRPYNGTS